MEGWLCPRCKKVNAPWVSQCSCTGCNDAVVTNVGDFPSTSPWSKDINWVTCCDTYAKTVPSALYADKISSATGTCNCSDKTE